MKNSSSVTKIFPIPSLLIFYRRYPSVQPFYIWHKNENESINVTFNGKETTIPKKGSPTKNSYALYGPSPDNLNENNVKSVSIPSSTNCIILYPYIADRHKTLPLYKKRDPFKYLKLILKDGFNFLSSPSGDNIINDLLEKEPKGSSYLKHFFSYLNPEKYPLKLVPIEDSKIDYNTKFTFIISTYLARNNEDFLEKLNNAVNTEPSFNKKSKISTIDTKCFPSQKTTEHLKEQKFWQENHTSISYKDYVTPSLTDDFILDSEEALKKGIQAACITCCGDHAITDHLMKPIDDIFITYCNLCRAIPRWKKIADSCYNIIPGSQEKNTRTSIEYSLLKIVFCCRIHCLFISTMHTELRTCLLPLDKDNKSKETHKEMLDALSSIVDNPHLLTSLIQVTNVFERYIHYPHES